MEAMITNVERVTRSRKPGLTGRRGTLTERVYATDKWGPIKVGQRIKVPGYGSHVVTDVRSYTVEDTRVQDVQYVVLED